jgi:hypothetical protein
LSGKKIGDAQIEGKKLGDVYVKEP